MTINLSQGFGPTSLRRSRNFCDTALASMYVRAQTSTHPIRGRVLSHSAWRDGNFHSISRKHLPNYLNEFQFRWNTRKMDDGKRVAEGN